jgi:hypothetical protein
MPVLLVAKDKRRLCKDGMLREFAVYGTYGFTVREYKSRGHALRAAQRIKGRVACIPDGYTVDAAGTVIQTVDCPDQPGYVNYVHFALEHFFI